MNKNSRMLVKELKKIMKKRAKNNGKPKKISKKLFLEREAEIIEELNSYTEDEKKDYIKTYQEKHKEE